jgi:hypothetical protein
VGGRPRSSFLVAIKSVYGVYDVVAPLCVILDAMHEVFPSGNARLVVVVNGAHATGTGVIWALKPPSSLATSLTFVFHAAPGPSPASSLFSFIFR